MTSPPPARDEDIVYAIASLPTPPPRPVGHIDRRARTLRRSRHLGQLTGGVGAMAAIATAVAVIAPSVLPGDGTQTQQAPPASSGEGSGPEGESEVIILGEELMDPVPLIERLREQGIAAGLITEGCPRIDGLTRLNDDIVNWFATTEGPGGPESWPPDVPEDAVILHPDRLPEGVTLLVGVFEPTVRESGTDAGGIGTGVAFRGLRLEPGEPLPTCVPKPLPW